MLMSGCLKDIIRRYSCSNYFQGCEVHRGLVVFERKYNSFVLLLVLVLLKRVAELVCIIYSAFFCRLLCKCLSNKRPVGIYILLSFWFFICKENTKILSQIGFGWRSIFDWWIFLKQLCRCQIYSLILLCLKAYLLMKPNSEFEYCNFNFNFDLLFCCKNHLYSLVISIFWYYSNLKRANMNFCLNTNSFRLSCKYFI